AGVIGERGDRREPGLLAVAAGQAVDVVTGLGVADQHAGRDHAAEILGGLGIDRTIVGVYAGIEGDLGLGGLEGAPRLGFGARARPRWRARHRAAPGSRRRVRVAGAGPGRVE